MPEGPEIRREAEALAKVLVGVRQVGIEYRVPRLARRARTLRGARIESATSHGKAMLIAYSNGLTHFSHNQLYGKWRIVTIARLAALRERLLPSIRVQLATATHAALLLSATQIELLEHDELSRQPYLAQLGPDVLDRATTAKLVEERLLDTRFARRSLGALLLDQSFLAGLGNYLRSDILHAAGLRHTVRPADLDAPTRARLAEAILALPRQSLRTSGTTNDPAVVRRLAATGTPRAARRFRVYDRQGLPCWTCGTLVQRIDVGGRGVYWCPRCQPDVPVGGGAIRRVAPVV
jgi:endonuclease-8